MSKKYIFILGLLLIIIVVAIAFWPKQEILAPTTNEPDTSGTSQEPVITVDSFESCVAAGNAVMESYPRQCRSESGELFVEDIGDELIPTNNVLLGTPRPNSVITSPLIITGEAKGTWYFEASFPVVVTNWDGLIIAEGYAQAQGDWMTEDFVPFLAEVSFDNPSFPDTAQDHFSHRGAVILKKDNPSGLPEHDDAVEIPVWFE